MGVIFFGEFFYPVKIKIFARTGFYTWLPSSTILVLPHDRQSTGIQASFLICSLAWCHYHPISTLLPGFARSCRTPVSRAIITAVNGMHGSRKLNTRFLVSPISSPHLRRSILLRMVNTVRVRANSLLDIQAWRVCLRAQPTTSWWATRAVGEVKFGEIFVPIQSMSIERNFYPVKILCYMVYYVMITTS